MKGCRSKDGQRDRGARLEMQEEARAGLALHPVPLVAQEHLRLQDAARNRSIAFPGPRPSNRAERSGCCFGRRGLPT